MRRLSIFLLILLTGSLLTIPAKAETTGYYGLSFDGVDDYVGTNFVLLPTQNFTLITVFYDAQDYNHQSGVCVVGQAFNYGLFSDDGGIYFGLRDNEGHINSISLSAGAGMHFVAGVWRADSKIAKIFVDGSEKEATFTLGTSWRSGGVPLLLGIGGPISGGGPKFRGKIYLVLVYSRALSDAEIQQIYENPLNPPEDGLVLWYAPDSVDPATGKWLDKSGNGHDGTVYGASYVPLRPIQEGQFSEAYGLYDNNTITDGILSQWSPGNLTEATFVVIANVKSTRAFLGNFVIGYGGGAKQGFALGYHPSSKILTLYISMDGVYTPLNTNIQLAEYANKTVLYAYTVKNGLQKAFINANNVGEWSDSYSQLTLENGKVWVGRSAWYDSDSDIYLVLVYSRALSDAEIQAIYNDPLNPPTNGLVLFYSPYSYDPASGKWLNVAPIFPTIPLAEELDGTNYGATAERVSIPKFYAYTVNQTLIPPENLSVNVLFNNTTVRELPSLLILPYGVPVNLSVSAVGYNTTNISITPPVDAVITYLTPLTVKPHEVEVHDFNTSMYTPAEFTIAQNPAQFDDTMKELFSGGYGGVMLALLVIALTVASLKIHRQPAVTATVVGTSISYLGVWSSSGEWMVLWTLIAMLVSAALLHAFGRWNS